MTNTIKIEELKKVCDFLNLDFKTYTNDKKEIISCEITWPFEGCPIDNFVVVNGLAIKK